MWCLTLGFCTCSVCASYHSASLLLWFPFLLFRPVTRPVTLLCLPLTRLPLCALSLFLSPSIFPLSFVSLFLSFPLCVSRSLNLSPVLHSLTKTALSALQSQLIASLQTRPPCYRHTNADLSRSALKAKGHAHRLNLRSK